MGREARRLLRYMLERVCLAMNGSLKVILVRTQREKERYRESLHLLREYLGNHEQDVGRKMDGRVHSDEVSDRNEERVTGNWRKCDPCCKVSKNLAELCSCSSVLWKVGLASNEIGHLAEAFSKQSVEGVAWLLLTAYSKT